MSGKALETLQDDLVTSAQTVDRAPDVPFPQAYAGVYDARRKACGRQLYTSVGIGREDRAAADRQRLENYRMFGAPPVALITTDRDLGTYGVLDCGAYVANFILASQSVGVASIPQVSFATASPFLRARFDWADNRRFVCGVSFGYEDATHIANQCRVPRVTAEHVARFIT